MQPHHAMVKLVRAVPHGKFPADVMRGLLEAVSLFPIGSSVKLSDGRVAKVIRANGAEYDRPICLDISDARDSSTRVINLCEELDLKVRNVITPAT